MPSRDPIRSLSRSGVVGTLRITGLRKVAVRSGNISTGQRRCPERGAIKKDRVWIDPRGPMVGSYESRPSGNDVSRCGGSRSAQQR
ncbi:hypothetical protein BN903_19 [Halorubrum sp. AJ67]|nr:hypothetical protein BN903_19 [Halorubrum sp. AJ67]